MQKGRRTDTDRQIQTDRQTCSRSLHSNRLMGVAEGKDRTQRDSLHCKAQTLIIIYELSAAMETPFVSPSGK